MARIGAANRVEATAKVMAGEVAARSAPPSRPPTMRAAFMCRKFRAVALETAGAGTSSVTIATDAGAPIVWAIPKPERQDGDQREQIGAGPGQHGLGHGQGKHRPERQQEHRARPEPIGQDAGIGAQEQDRQPGCGVDEPDRGGRAGHLEDVPTERGVIHEVGTRRRQHRAEEEAEGAVIERGQPSPVEP